MMALIFIVSMLAAILFGGLMVKSAKKKLAEERARRLKIAEGKWDELEEAKPRKPSRVFNALKAPFAGLKKIGSSMRQPKFPMPTGDNGEGFAYQPAGTPETAEALAKRRIPSNVEEMLGAWHAYTDGVVAVDAAEKSYVTAMRSLERTKSELSERLQKGSLESWAQECLKAYQALRLAGRDYASIHDQLKPLRDRWNSANRELDAAIQEVAEYCKRSMILPEDLSQAHNDIVEIAQVTKSECATVVDPPRTNRPPVGWETPELGCSEADSESEKLMSLIKSILNAARQAATAHAEVVHGYKSVSEMLGSVSHEEPTKPTDSEVQGFIGSALAWADTVQKYVITAHGGMVQVAEARTTAEEQLKDLSNAQHRVVSAVRRTVTWAENFLQTLDNATAVDVAEVAGNEPDQAWKAWKANFARSVKTGSLESKTEGWANRSKISAWSNALTPVEGGPGARERGIELNACLDTVNLLSDRARALLNLARFVSIEVEQLCQDLLEEPDGQFRLVRAIGSQPASDAELNKVAAIRNAMRKLGFAIAQSNAAAAKVVIAEQHPTNLREPQEPSLDETNVDKYVRGFKRWHEDLSHNESVMDARARKVEGLQLHLDDRTRQITDAATGIGTLLENPSFISHNECVSAELDASLRAATMLFERYHDPALAQQPEEGVEDSGEHELQLQDDEGSEEGLDLAQEVEKQEVSESGTTDTF